jgi:hypothetical protein
MADAATTPAPVTVDNSDETRTVTWTCTGNATGTGAAFGQFPDRTVGITGTFGSATVTIQGSADGGTTWDTLHDYLGNTLVYTTHALALIAENPPLIRAITSGGTSTSIVVTLMGSRA